MFSKSFFELYVIQKKTKQYFYGKLEKTLNIFLVFFLKDISRPPPSEILEEMFFVKHLP